MEWPDEELEALALVVGGRLGSDAARENFAPAMPLLVETLTGCIDSYIHGVLGDPHPGGVYHGDPQPIITE